MTATLERWLSARKVEGQLSDVFARALEDPVKVPEFADLFDGPGDDEVAHNRRAAFQKAFVAFGKHKPGQIRRLRDLIARCADTNRWRDFVEHETQRPDSAWAEKGTKAAAEALAGGFSSAESDRRVMETLDPGGSSGGGPPMASAFEAKRGLLLAFLDSVIAAAGGAAG